MNDPGVTKEGFSVKYLFQCFTRRHSFRAAFICTGLRLYMELSADSGWMMLPTPDSDVSHAGLGQGTGYMEPSLLSLEDVDGFLSHTDYPGHPYFHTHSPHPQARTPYSQVPGKKTA